MLHVVCLPSYHATDFIIDRLADEWTTTYFTACRRHATQHIIIIIIMPIAKKCGKQARKTIKICLSMVFAVDEADFLRAIQAPLPRDQSIGFLATPDGYPAFDIRSNASIQMSLDVMNRRHLPAVFSIHAVFMPRRKAGGFLFAVVGPSSQNHVQFGLRVSSTDTKSLVSLYYAAVDEGNEPFAAFNVTPPLTGRWTKLVVKVKDSEVSLLVDCTTTSQLTKTVVGRKTIKEGLTFENGSKVYVAQAGPVLEDDVFEVRTAA